VETFSDDFNRADGPIGNGWSADGLNPRIASQRVIASGNSRVWRVPWAWSAKQRARILTGPTGSTEAFAQPAVRFDGTSKSCYTYLMGKTSTTMSHTIVKWTGNNQTNLGSTTEANHDGPTYTLELVYDAGVLKAYCDGVLKLTVNDNAWDAYTAFGFRNSALTWTDDFYGDDVPALTGFAVSPNLLDDGTYPAPVEFIGTGTAWTPGTPGAPTFTVDKGSISDQSIDSGTHGTGTYTPPTSEDTATFTDPSTNDTAQVALTTGFAVESGGSCPWTAEQVGVEDPGESVFGDLRLLKLGVAVGNALSVPNDVLDLIETVTNRIGLAETLYNLIHDHEGLYTWQDVMQSLENINQSLLIQALTDLGVIDTNVAAIRGEESLTLRGTINRLAGVPNLSHQDLDQRFLDLTNNGLYSLLSVLQWIDAVRGASNVDLTMIYSLLSSIAPPDLSPITDYLDWLTSFHSLNLSSLNALLLGIQNVTNNTHDDLQIDYNDLAARNTNDRIQSDAQFDHLHGDLLSDYTSLYNRLNEVLSALSIEHSALHVHLHELLGKVDTLQNDVTYIKNHLGQETLAAPVWPGLAQVTIGNQSPLGTGVTLDGPMHGVIINVTDPGNRQPPFQFAGDKSHQRIGAITFQSDNGDNEFPQLLGFEHAIYTPKSMRIAQRAKLRCPADVIGTVTAWRLTT
jgi:hypothetical protein